MLSIITASGRDRVIGFSFCKGWTTRNILKRSNQQFFYVEELRSISIERTNRSQSSEAD